jgi:hypothetical protein
MKEIKKKRQAANNSRLPDFVEIAQALLENVG